jgi:hypothetical protein
MKQQFTDKIKVRDLTTKELFTLRAGDNTQVVTTMDGVRVKLHPVSLRLMVPEKGKFDGSTLLGPRPMERV